MAEGRMLKKKISTDVTVADLESPWHIILFTWGIAHLDIEGRITGDPREYKAKVAPLLDGITKAMVMDFFNKAVELGLIDRYSIEDKWFIQYPKFKLNQSLNPAREAPSKIPDPSGQINDTKTVGQYGYYGEGWPKIKEEIRQRDKVCRRCGKTPEQNKRALGVHHLKDFKYFKGDFVRANNPINLVALCQICHLEVRALDEDLVMTQCGLDEDSMSTHRELIFKLSKVKDKLKEGKLKKDKDLPPPKKSKPVKTSIPDNFEISPAVRKWAEAYGFGRLEEHLESFKDNALAKGWLYTDWDAHFRNFIRGDWGHIRAGGPLGPGGFKQAKGAAAVLESARRFDERRGKPNAGS